MGDVVKSVFGSSTQGGGATNTIYKPEDEARIRGQANLVMNRGGDYQSLLDNLRGQAAGSVPGLETGFQTNLGLRTDFKSPTFGKGLDAESEQLLSQSFQDIANRTGAQRNQLNSSLRNNPLLAQLMGVQLEQNASLGANPLRFQAQQAQDSRQIGRAQAGNEALNFINNALTTGGQFQNQGLQNINQARGQQFQMGQAGRGEQAQYGGQRLATDQSVYDMLSQMGQQFGTQVSSQNQQQGGLFGGSGFLGLGLF